MKKFKLVACAAAVAAMAGGNAFASVSLDTGLPASGGGTYVGETNFATPTVTLTKGADADQAATVALGATFAIDAVAYVRFDLPAGVTFTLAPALAIAGGGSVQAISQGGAGSNFVIFPVAPAALGSLDAAQILTLTGANLTVANKDAVSLRYRLYETLTNAVNQVLDLKNTQATFVSFANAIQVTAGAAQAGVADVAANTGAYTKFTGAATTQAVSAFTVTYTPRALVSSGVNTANSGVVLAGTNSVNVTGDFSAAGTATLGAYTATLGAGQQNATFSNVTAADLTGGPLLVNYNVNGTSQIAVSGYSGTVNLVGQAGFTPVGGATGTGQITRNGTILKAAFAEATSAAGVASTINLTNTSSRAANFTVRCLLNNGSVVGRPGTVPAATAMRFGLTSANGLACPAANVRSVELTFDVPEFSVIGSVVRQNTSTGAASFDGMVGNK